MPRAPKVNVCERAPVRATRLMPASSAPPDPALTAGRQVGRGGGTQVESGDRRDEQGAAEHVPRCQALAEHSVTARRHRDRSTRTRSARARRDTSASGAKRRSREAARVDVQLAGTPAAPMRRA